MILRRAAVAQVALLALLVGFCIATATLALRAAEPGGTTPAKTVAESDEPLELPEGWPERLPPPVEKTNCVRCHLQAGRELTYAVMDFSHSVHDLNLMSCNDCHGGDTENDALAHDDSAGFIGTKLSAHLENCADCHGEAYESLAAGPHAWDFSERINLDYPTCIDCHGNHDVGNPPEGFLLKEVCLDCHEGLEDDMSEVASIIEQNDKYWATMIEVRSQTLAEEEPVPEKFQQRVDQLRHQTMHLVHRLGEIPQKKADDLNAKSEALRKDLEAWLKKAS